MTQVFNEWIRRQVFWTLDFVQGSKIRTHYQDIKFMLENTEDPVVVKKHEDYLLKILKYASENIPYYQQLRDLQTLTSFPVVNKNIIRDHYEAFLSSQYSKGKFIIKQTSGSTGTPFSVRHNNDKRDRVYAEMIYLWGKAGYRIGMKYVFFRVRYSYNKLTALVRNVVVLGIGSQDQENFEKIRVRLKNDHKIGMILSYPSTLDNLANYLLRCGDTPDMFNFKTIIGYGEAFPEVTRKKLQKIFNSTIVSIYSNEENGQMAIECVENKEFHINSASYHIELLDINKDEPVQEGEVGRIVVTDLFNYAMPLIRYDTGDLAVWKKVPDCGWTTPVFTSTQGQRTDLIFDTQGKAKSPHNISVLMSPFDKLLQYQFIQQDARQYVLKLNGARKYYDDAKFESLIKKLLGEDSEVIIEHVDEIPVLASGKRKEVICNYHNPSI
jgi:phenylacetate-CoA ligase